MSDAFTVRPFAFMRLTHEAIRVERAALLAHAEAFAAQPTAAGLDAVRASLEELQRGIALHALQEEQGFFPLLDARFDAVATQAGFFAEHEAEHARFDALDAAVAAAGDASAPAAASLLEAVRAWADANEAHLKHEEGIMMPLTQRVADTLEGRAAAVRGIIDAADAEATAAWQVGWVLSRLHTHRPFGKVRMYVAALEATHAADLHRIQPAIRAALPPAMVAKLSELG